MSSITNYGRIKARRRTRKYMGVFGRHLFLIFFSLIMFYPIIWWIGASLKSPAEMRLPSIFPSQPVWSNYVEGWASSGRYTFTTYFRNSLTIELFNVIGSICSTALCGFGFGRLRFKGKTLMFTLLMITMMLPGQVTIIPQYLYYHALGFVDSYVPLILPHYFGGAFFVYLVVQFVRGIPRDLDEAAKIDGANLFTIFYRVILPLLKAPLVTVGIFTFLWSWDNFFSQVLYISSISKFTVSLALRMFIDQFEIKWGYLLAMSLLSIMPSVAIFMGAQKQIVEGIATTGIKG
ncbi:MAG: carbohydrate ABC transporter permease [Treponema sp.]|jgi:multiple sugar transport system permease protein|nr:carbohydrate ABC transporter permease [Treponema sp.]